MLNHKTLVSCDRTYVDGETLRNKIKHFLQANESE